MPHFHSFLLRVAQVISFITSSSPTVPLIRDLLRIKQNSFIASNKLGQRVRIRSRRGDRYAFYENLLRMDYLRHGIYITEGDIVIDIGAHIGCFTILASSLVGSAGKVIAIEPDPENYQELLFNISLNKLSNVIPFNVAIAEKNGEVELYRTGNSMLASIIPRIFTNAKDLDKIQAKSMTLSDLIIQTQLTKIDLLKMDCEGTEYEILDTLNANHASLIKQIAIEVHKISGRNQREITNTLREMGFVVQGDNLVYAVRS
jgi:FkbM family methyltransferase